MSAKTKTTIQFETTFTLNEDETRALAGIFGYSTDAFLKVFYEKMGKAYVQPFEAGVRSLHETIRRVCNPAIHEIDQIRGRLRRAKE